MEKFFLLSAFIFSVFGLDPNNYEITCQFCNCDNYLKSVECGPDLVFEFMPAFPENTETLVIRDSHFVGLKARELVDLPNLERLAIVRSGLVLIEPDAFAGLKSLKVLDLSGNQLDDSLSNGTFRDLPMLVKLNLSNNLFKSLHIVDSQQFGSNSILNILDISRNPLETTSKGLKLPSVAKLSLSGIRLAAFYPEGIAFKNGKIAAINTSAITHLDISNTDAYFEPNAFQNLQNLQELQAAGTHVADFEHLRFLNHVKLLNFSSSGLPTTYFTLDLESVDTLDLSNTDLTKFGINFAPNLRILNVSGNALKDINGLINVPKLEILNADGNQLQSIPIIATRMENLKILSLSNNQIHRVAPKMLENFPLLRELYLVANHLEDVGASFQTVSLVLLDLSNNQLSQFDLSNINPQMEVLNLSFNHFSQFVGNVAPSPSGRYGMQLVDLSNNPGYMGDLDFLQSFNELEILYLSQFNVRHIPEGFLLHFPLLKIVDFSENFLQKSNFFAAFAGIDQICLEILNLALNQIRTVEEIKFLLGSCPRELDLSGNQFDCNCDLMKLNEHALKLINYDQEMAYFCANSEGHRVGIQEFLVSCRAKDFSASVMILISIFVSGFAAGCYCWRKRGKKLKRKNIKYQRLRKISIDDSENCGDFV